MGFMELFRKKVFKQKIAAEVSGNRRRATKKKVYKFNNFERFGS